MKRFLIPLAVVLAVGLAALAWHFWPRRITYLTDADLIRAPAEAAVVREILWEPPTALGEPLNSPADEYEARPTADGRMLFFVRGRPGGDADIFVCSLTAEGWSEPAAVDGVNSGYDDLGPAPSPDGSSLYFYSDRPGGSGGYDLWVSRRGEAGWEPPTNLGAFVNSPYNDYGPALFPDGSVLCFASNRPPAPADLPDEAAWQATVREDLYRHDYDLYATNITEVGLASASPLEQLNTEFNEGAAGFSPAGDFLYFCSDRPGGIGGFDLYRSRRIGDRYEQPTNLGSEVNTSANELDPALEMGGYALHFSSDRAAGPQPEAAKHDYDLYRTVSKEVFRDVEVQRATLDWAAVWALVGPNLMWGLTALLASLLLLALLRDARRRKLSLLARCLLISLLAHLLLMLLFNATQVTTALASALRKSGKIQISFASNARADELATQIRGQLTDITPPAVEVPAASRREVSLERPREETALAELSSDRRPIEMTLPPAIKSVAVEASAPENSLEPPSDERPLPPESPSRLEVPSDVAAEQSLAADEAQISVTAQFASVRRQSLPSPTSQPAATMHEENSSLNTTATLAKAMPRPSLVGPASTPEAEITHGDTGHFASDPTATSHVPRFALPTALELDLPGTDGPARQASDEPAQAAAPAWNLTSGNPSSRAPSPVASTDSVSTTVVALPTGETGPLSAEAKPLPIAPEAGGEAQPLLSLPQDGNTYSTAQAVPAPQITLGLPFEVEAPEPGPNDMIGSIRGSVSEAHMGRPLVGAAIRLDLPDQPAATTDSGAGGRYVLPIPQVPEFFALTATLDGFVPQTVNVPAAAVKEGRVDVDFRLEPVTELVVALEEAPIVHHLGNDAYEGQINSQFQRGSEGTRFRGAFELSANQLAARPGTAKVEMLVKGVQCPHMIRINGRRVPQRLNRSPSDGSFGAFSATFDASILRAGPNNLVIRNVECRDDTDDFEFVNVQIRLIP